MRERDDSARVLDGLDPGYAGYGEDIAFLEGVDADEVERGGVGERDMAGGEGKTVGWGFSAGGDEVDFGGRG